MPGFNIYVGNLDDPKFSWEGDWNGNMPKRITPFFPNLGRRGLELGWINNGFGAIDSKQTDWGCLVYKMRGKDILAFYDDCCKYWETLFKISTPTDHLENRVIIQSLEAEKIYGLVQYELIETD